MALPPLLKRRSKDAAASGAVDAEELQSRTRARRRLVGAAILLVLGVISFPLLFETQPRPVPVDIPMVIPSREGAAPLAVPPRLPRPASGAEAGTSGALASVPGARAIERPVAASQAAAAGAAAPAAASAPAPRPAALSPAPPAPAAPAAVAAPAASTPAPAAARAPAKAEAPPGVRPEAKATPRPDARSDAKAEVKAETKADAKAAPSPKAESRPETKPETKAAAKEEPKDAAAKAGRFVVQVGAYADEASAREARQKVERLGLKTYTQVVEIQGVKRIRVRIGPFETAQEASQALATLKAGKLPGAVLTL